MEHRGPPGSAAPPSAPAEELAGWEFAGLMLTYWCSSRCAFCYVHAGPQRAGDMSVDTAVALWRSLDRLAAACGKTMRVHLTGGEPFRDWVRLVAILRAARDAGLTRLEQVETNAFWAVEDGQTRARLELLDALGLERLVVSTDVFHQEFVPLERVRRCVETARRVLGAGRVRVRWWDFYQQPVDVRAMSPGEKRRAFQAALARHHERLTGRAAETLAELLPRQPAAALAGQDCRDEILRSRHVHVDPFGNVFPGTCAGIILGRVRAGRGTGPAPCANPSRGLQPARSCESERVSHADDGRSVEAVWHDLAANWRQHPVVSAVVAGGSYALLQQVKPLGYRELPTGYAGKCHLCAHIRQFLVDQHLWPEFVGPSECYGRSGDAPDGRAPLSPTPD